MDQLSAGQQSDLKLRIVDAAWKNDVPRVRRLVRAGADVNHKGGIEQSAFLIAAERGHADIVGRLLQTTIAVNHVNNLGWTARHEAIILGDGSAPYVDTSRR